MKIKKKIYSFKELEADLKEISLMSLYDYDKYRKIIPLVDEDWWLRSHGSFKDTVTVVLKDGSVQSHGYAVHFNDIGVRPTLRVRTENSNILSIQEEVEIYDKEWIILNIDGYDVFLISKNIITERMFDKEDNNWENSNLKDWLTQQFSL